MVDLRFSNVYKYINDNNKIENFTFEINRAETVAIHCHFNVSAIMIQLILKDLKPSSGSITIADNTKILRVFADTGYDPRMTVKEIIQFYANINEKTIYYTEVVDIFGLKEYEKERFAKLANTVKILLGLAAAYVQNPNIIIVHEPTINWQKANPNIIKRIIDFIKSKGIGVLILTMLKDDAIWLAEKSYYVGKQGLIEFELDSDKQEPSKAKLKIIKIPVKLDNKILLFNPFEIDYVEAFNNNTCIYVSGKGYTCTLNISELENRLETYGFFRNHRSYLVNLQKIKEVVTWSKSSNSLVLNDTVKSTVPISKAKLESLKHIINI
ncbi:LytTR family transcriptional regulator DNA-binding domain-containing protein [Clostridium sp. 'deep sea']|uniref:LytTR family transcriptional regulator DNA-binding domain-containing protein n=1 Tax=Clostridium sp. 'deep sea' TaxID=2779445 RepID=UPI0018965A33|nr:LytTR family transcriptional regulator DNA-binding domain-containing protein [Clostridium sp. 'deep sea']QOR35447.1 LytTR family transcriptional regulator DNA-binding domain-containing protein [Clostridium sp. 'deep sea']